MFAITAIKGVGRHHVHVVLRKANIGPSKKAAEFFKEAVECIITFVQNPQLYTIPDWFLNRQKDINDGPVQSGPGQVP